MDRKSRINERQKKVLYCAVREYIVSKKPVSSERILSTSNVRCSGATIRNDMRKLEYLGYMFQPHTSAGRIPTDKGFRFYVEETLKIMSEYQRRSSGIYSRYPMAHGDMERIFEGAVRALARMVKGAVVLEKPSIEKLRIVRIVVTPITKNYYVFSVITELGLVKFIPFKTFSRIDYQKLENAMNELLSGFDLASVENRTLSNNWEQELLEMSEMLVESLRDDYRNNLLKSGIDVLMNEADDHQIKELRRVSQLISDDAELFDFMEKIETTPAIFIGSEHEIDGLENFSIFVDSYCKQGAVMGRILIVTPKVVRYEEVFNALRYMTSRLTEYFTIATREEVRQ